MYNRISKYLLLIFCAQVAHVQAQFISTEGRFSIDQQRGCHDLTVTVTNIDSGTGIVLYQFEGSASPITNIPTFTYIISGDFWLFQFIQGATGQKKDSILVQILDPLIPTITLQSCNSNDIQIQILDTSYDIYEIDYGDGAVIQQPVGTTPSIHSYASSIPVTITVTGLYTTANNRCGVSTQQFTPVPTVLPAFINSISIISNSSSVINYILAPNSISKLEIAVNSISGFQVLKDLSMASTMDTITNLTIPTTGYCFRIATSDACSNFKSYSNIVCSDYASSSAENNQITITWNTLLVDNSQTVNIIRDGTVLVNLPGTVAIFTDTSVLCKVNYCYDVRINYPNGSISNSNTSCDLAFSTDKPPAIDNISSIVNGNQIFWNWPVPANTTLSFYELSFSTQSGLSLQKDTSTINQFTSIIEEDSVQCLKINITDNCDNISVTGLQACSLLLAGQPANDGSVLLDWPNYVGWITPPIEYVVVTMDESLAVLDSISVGLSNSFIEPIVEAQSQVSNYAVWAISSDPLVSHARSNIVRVTRTPVLSTPQAFTPNGDNLNDIFVVKGRFINRIDLTIFTRWGEAIFNSLDGAGWDGTFEGKKAPVGNYIYRINIEDSVGNNHIRSGTILLLKN